MRRLNQLAYSSIALKGILKATKFAGKATLAVGKALKGGFVGGIGKGFKGIRDLIKSIGKTIFVLFIPALLALLNSPFFEKTKDFILDVILPAAMFLYENIIKPIGKFIMESLTFAFQKFLEYLPEIKEGLLFLYDNFLVPVGGFIKDSLGKAFNSIFKGISGIYDGIKMLMEGDILGGISKLFETISTFVVEMADNALTLLFNTVGRLFGFDSTDSVFGALKGIFTRLYDVVNDLIGGSNLFQFIDETIKLPIEVGDVVLGGKFKNKRIVVKDIGENEKGDITINGKPILRVRITGEKDKNGTE